MAFVTQRRKRGGAAVPERDRLTKRFCAPPPDNGGQDSCHKTSPLVAGQPLRLEFKRSGETIERVGARQLKDGNALGHKRTQQIVPKGVQRVLNAAGGISDIIGPDEMRAAALDPLRGLPFLRRARPALPGPLMAWNGMGLEFLDRTAEIDGVFYRRAQLARSAQAAQFR